MSDAFAYRALTCAFILAALPAAAGELADPTRPGYLPPATAPATGVRAPSWRVESIIVSPGRRLAVINGRVVAVNDRVGGARVVEITPYEVRLEYQGETRRAALVPARVKHPANSTVEQ